MKALRPGVTWNRTLSGLVLAGLLSAPVAAQETSAPASPVPTAEDAPPRTDRALHLYVAMWTSHLKGHVLHLQNNWAIGISDRGFYGATFINSFGRRAY